MIEGISGGRLREIVQEWFIEDGWSIRQESAPNATWAWVADNGLGRKVVAGQRVGKEHQLVVQGAVAIDDATSERINQLPEDERNDFLWDLRFELLRTDLEFTGVEVPLRRVEVHSLICLEALTKDTFRQKVAQVRKGLLIVLWMLARKLAQQPPRRELGFHR